MLRTLMLVMVAAVAVDARKAQRQRQAVQASSSGLPSAGRPIVRGGSKTPPMAMILPADNFPLMVAEEGAVNFLSLYGGVLTLRILLSWFPQAQSVALLKPIFTVSDVYLNLFRGVIPSIAGLDISPIAAFFVLNLLTSSVASLGASAPGSHSPPRALRMPQMQMPRLEARPHGYITAEAPRQFPGIARSLDPCASSERGTRAVAPVVSALGVTGGGNGPPGGRWRLPRALELAAATAPDPTATPLLSSLQRPREMLSRVRDLVSS